MFQLGVTTVPRPHARAGILNVWRSKILKKELLVSYLFSLRGTVTDGQADQSVEWVDAAMNGPA